MAEQKASQRLGPHSLMSVIGSSNKENERRAPIHPDHLERIDPDLRKRMLFEEGYGTPFGMTDATLKGLVRDVLPRTALFEKGDIICLPKPTEADFPFFRPGQVLWGWPHCVQGTPITQLGIDKKLTMIAWEAMHIWHQDNWDLHVLHMNNELAGYCSVLHAMQLRGLTNHYGRVRKACVISFGSTGRGAIHALKAIGFGDITLFTQRPGHIVKAPIPSVKHWRFEPKSKGSVEAELLLTNERISMAKAIGHFDVCVNCIMQDTDAPLIFVRNDEINELRKDTLIIDVSCDQGMGFEFARPTSFEDPMFSVGDHGCWYYGVDHTPTYLWDSSTFEISQAIVPLVKDVMGGPAKWSDNPTIARAIEIRDGVIENPKIISFQNRRPDYPHPVLE